MILKKVNIKNFKSIKSSGDIVFTNNIYILAGQNESGKSAILEALNQFSTGNHNDDTINFEEDKDGNTIQEINCTYEIKDNKIFCGKLKNTLLNEFDITDDTVIDEHLLNKINYFTITKKWIYGKTKSLEQCLDENFNNILKDAIKLESFNFEEKKQLITKIILDICPKIILFNDFSDILPDKILVNDLKNKNSSAKGYNAVKNLEKQLNKEFVEIANLQTLKRQSVSSEEIDRVSANFMNDWKQQVHGENEVKIKFFIENENNNGQFNQYISFAIETKDKVSLEPKKRSKGLLWFLSTWLELKAKENEPSLVILYDEPGLYLHMKAHQDVLKLFNYLSKDKGHQIIYSTHLPTLINTNTISNIGLVINLKNEGTIVDEITSEKIDLKNKKDALAPIGQTMGFDPLMDFGILSKKNVLLEGISDFWYLKGMQIILNRKSDYEFIPGIGISNGKINNLVSFCIGYGLDWVLLMDGGENPQNISLNLKEYLFGNKKEQDKVEIGRKIKLLKEKEIEDLFSINDIGKIQLIKGKNNKNKEIKPSDLISDKRKFIYSKSFYLNVKDGKIKKEDISNHTIKNFNNIFDWIESSFVANNENNDNI